jgi:hypothetical protein
MFRELAVEILQAGELLIRTDAVPRDSPGEPGEDFPTCMLVLQKVALDVRRERSCKTECGKAGRGSRMIQRYLDARVCVVGESFHGTLS